MVARRNKRARQVRKAECKALASYAGRRYTVLGLFVLAALALVMIYVPSWLLVLVAIVHLVNQVLGAAPDLGGGLTTGRCSWWSGSAGSVPSAIP